MPSAVVTGANRGLGLQTARELARRGYRVWLTARDPAEAERAAHELAQERHDVRPWPLDVAESASVDALAKRLKAEPAIDALVNNAGTSLPGFDARVAEETLNVNYRGAARVTDALLSLLAPNANVVMVSSGMGELSQFSGALQKRLLAPTLSRSELEEIACEFVSAVGSGTCAPRGFPSNAYSVSKALLNGFTRVLARELSGSERRVNAVCPGWVKTRMGGSTAPRSLEQGASGIVWAATLGPKAESGGFFRDAKPIAW